jgi:hypothetical protein
MCFKTLKRSTTLETEGIQDDFMDKDDKTEVKSKAHCFIKIKNRKAIKLIRHAVAAVVKIDIYT